MSTITFSKTAFEEYKKIVLKAIEDKHESFVHNNSLYSVEDGKRLINQFEKGFSDGFSKSVTLPYKP